MVAGGFLLAAGVLIAGLTGLCSLNTGMEAVRPTGGSGYQMPFVGLVPIFGSIPCLIGVAMACLGWSLLSEAQRRSANRTRALAAIFGYLSIGGPALYVAGLLAYAFASTVASVRMGGPQQMASLTLLAFGCLAGWLGFIMVRRAFRSFRKGFRDQP
jgi:hypothetical protein